MEHTENDLAAWVQKLTAAPIPVLKRTLRELGALHTNLDATEVRDLAEVLRHDPLMTLLLLRYLQRHKRSSQVNDVVQIEQGLMMLGLKTFFDKVVPVQSIEDTLQGKMQALTGLLHVIKRATHAAYYARDWAVRLKDLHFDEVRMVALMHNFAEILMWCHATAAMSEIHRLQSQDRTRRTRDVQIQVLGFKLSDLQLELAKQWNLPSLLLQFMQRNNIQDRRMRIVVLAINLSSHAENGWNDAALPDDYRDIGELLCMPVTEVMKTVQRN